MHAALALALAVALVLYPGSAAAQDASVAGVVWDGLRGAPLAGARVELAGTRAHAVAGADGRYRIDHPYSGRYQVAVSHPRLDSIGFDVDPVEVELVRGRTAAADLGVPAYHTVLDRLCGAQGDPARALVVGRVANAAGEGTPGVRLVLTWSSHTVDGRARGSIGVGESFEGEEAVSGPGGRYHACAVPTGERVTVRVGEGRRLRPAGVLRIPSATVYVHDVRVP